MSAKQAGSPFNDMKETWLLDISKHYYTEEATRHLANALLGDKSYCFLSNLLARNGMLWSSVAFEVMHRWVRKNGRSATRMALLDAMEKSNPDAADFFGRSLIRGEKLSFPRTFNKTFKHALSALAIPLSLCINPNFSLIM